MVTRRLAVASGVLALVALGGCGSPSSERNEVATGAPRGDVADDGGSPSVGTKVEEFPSASELPERPLLTMPVPDLPSTVLAKSAAWTLSADSADGQLCVRMTYESTGGASAGCGNPSEIPDFSVFEVAESFDSSKHFLIGLSSAEFDEVVVELAGGATVQVDAMALGNLGVNAFLFETDGSRVDEMRAVRGDGSLYSPPDGMP